MNLFDKRKSISLRIKVQKAWNKAISLQKTRQLNELLESQGKPISLLIYNVENNRFYN